MAIIIFVLIVALLLWVVYIYNTLVKQRNHVREGWSGIDVQLKRRHNLIPNLVESVKAYAGHESSVFEEVAEIRSKIGQVKDIAEQGKLETQLSLGLGKLIAIAENYPDLKASENFMQLQQELSNIEDQIQLARRYYNGTARDYNTTIESFPQILIANFFKFEPFDYFEIDNDKEREVPKVDFSKQTQQ
ncbi:LemA family protein [Legionella spiritensis]|uniref:LemA family protein n=1 Tax=Legionella spiritensis TaxID=452 RepID=UPI000F6DDBAB|nr:LemA family protein [Legionella spiritensis]VEG90617.1 LemA protein [Legionella spiritensis]